MSSPIFDATFGTGRFRYEEPMTTSGKPSPEPQEATPADELRQQIMDPNIPKNEREWWAAHEIERLTALAQSDAQPKQDVRNTFTQVLASLVAAVSLLKSGGKAAKKAAPSDKMFDQMILDYERAIEQGRAALAQSDAEPVERVSELKRQLVEARKLLGENFERRDENGHQ